MRRAATALAILGSLLPAASAGAAASELIDLPGAKFPERQWVLSLPEQRDVKAGDITVTENGRAVEGLEVAAGDQAGARSFGTVLAIDASESMHSGAIEQAMAAARTFVKSLKSEQPIGVVLFSREHRVALELTNDPVAIAKVLDQTPPLTKGTQIFDATVAGIEMLRDGGIRAGSVVVLSDGADAGSSRTPDSVATLARRSGVRVHTVGLSSPSFEEGPLNGLATATGGVYARADSLEQLERIYGSLGERLSNEYLVSYRSLAPAGSEVAVEMRVAGFDGAASAGYHAPDLPPAPVAAPTDDGFWGSTAAVVAMALLLAGLLALALLLVVRGPRLTAAERIAPFVGTTKTANLFEPDDVAAPEKPSMMQRALERLRWWPRFAETVELSGIGMPPRQVAIAIALATALLVWMLVLLGRPVAAGLFLLTPFFVNAVLNARVERSRRAFGDQLADTLQVVASAMRAGHSFEGGLAVAAEDAGQPMRDELLRVVNDERLGVPLEEAMAASAKRMRSAEFDQIGTVVTVQRSSGGNMAELLDRAVDTIRYRSDLRRLVHGLTAQGRLGGIVVTALPVVVAVLLSTLQPGYYDPLMDTSTGPILMVGCAISIGVGWLFIRKIVDIKV